MATAPRKSLEDYLALEYPYAVVTEDGSYVITFPDLFGCVTQAETREQIGPMAEDARQAWIEAAYQQGLDIPLPSQTEEYSGRFNIRLPRSLHRDLAEEAKRERVSLNQYVVMLLARRHEDTKIERLIKDVIDQVRDASSGRESEWPAFGKPVYIRNVVGPYSYEGISQGVVRVIP